MGRRYQGKQTAPIHLQLTGVVLSRYILDFANDAVNGAVEPMVVLRSQPAKPPSANNYRGLMMTNRKIATLPPANIRAFSDLRFTPSNDGIENLLPLILGWRGEGMPHDEKS